MASLEEYDHFKRDALPKSALQKDALSKSALRATLPATSKEPRAKIELFQEPYDFQGFTRDECVKSSSLALLSKYFVQHDESEEKELQRAIFTIEGLTCPICSLTFSSGAHLHKHRTYCGKSHVSLPKETDLGREHEELFREPFSGMLFCPWCPLLCSNISALRKHLSLCKEKVGGRVNKTTLEKVPCPECSKEYSSLDNLLMHLQSHYIGDLICSPCRMEFLSIETLSIHLETCSSKEFYKCNDCSRLFINSSSLRAHLESCRSFIQCLKCSEVIIERVSCTNHMLMHLLSEWTMKGFRMSDGVLQQVVECKRSMETSNVSRVSSDASSDNVSNDNRNSSTPSPLSDILKNSNSSKIQTKRISLEEWGRKNNVMQIKEATSRNKFRPEAKTNSTNTNGCSLNLAASESTAGQSMSPSRKSKCGSNFIPVKSNGSLVMRDLAGEDTIRNPIPDDLSQSSSDESFERESLLDVDNFPTFESEEYEIENDLGESANVTEENIEFNLDEEPQSSCCKPNHGETIIVPPNVVETCCNSQETSDLFIPAHCDSGDGDQGSDLTLTVVNVEGGANLFNWDECDTENENVNDEETCHKRESQIEDKRCPDYPLKENVWKQVNILPNTTNDLNEDGDSGIDATEDRDSNNDAAEDFFDVCNEVVIASTPLTTESAVEVEAKSYSKYSLLGEHAYALPGPMSKYRKTSKFKAIGRQSASKGSREVRRTVRAKSNRKISSDSSLLKMTKPCNSRERVESESKVARGDADTRNEANFLSSSCKTKTNVDYDSSGISCKSMSSSTTTIEGLLPAVGETSGKADKDTLIKTRGMSSKEDRKAINEISPFEQNIAKQLDGLSSRLMHQLLHSHVKDSIKRITPINESRLEKPKLNDKAVFPFLKDCSTYGYLNLQALQIIPQTHDKLSLDATKTPYVDTLMQNRFISEKIKVKQIPPNKCSSVNDGTQFIPIDLIKGNISHLKTHKVFRIGKDERDLITSKVSMNIRSMKQSNITVDHHSLSESPCETSPQTQFALNSEKIIENCENYPEIIDKSRDQPDTSASQINVLKVPTHDLGTHGNRSLSSTQLVRQGKELEKTPRMLKRAQSMLSHGFTPMATTSLQETYALQDALNATTSDLAELLKEHPDCGLGVTSTEKDSIEESHFRPIGNILAEEADNLQDAFKEAISGIVDMLDESADSNGLSARKEHKDASLSVSQYPVLPLNSLNPNEIGASCVQEVNTLRVSKMSKPKILITPNVIQQSSMALAQQNVIVNTGQNTVTKFVAQFEKPLSVIAARREKSMLFHGFTPMATVVPVKTKVTAISQQKVTENVSTIGDSSPLLKNLIGSKSKVQDGLRLFIVSSDGTLLPHPNLNLKVHDAVFNKKGNKLLLGNSQYLQKIPKPIFSTLFNTAESGCTNPVSLPTTDTSVNSNEAFEVSLQPLEAEATQNPAKNVENSIAKLHETVQSEVLDLAKDNMLIMNSDDGSENKANEDIHESVNHKLSDTSLVNATDDNLGFIAEPTNELGSAFAFKETHNCFYDTANLLVESAIGPSNKTSDESDSKLISIPNPTEESGSEDVFVKLDNCLHTKQNSLAEPASVTGSVTFCDKKDNCSDANVNPHSQPMDLLWSATPAKETFNHSNANLNPLSQSMDVLGTTTAAKETENCLDAHQNAVGEQSAPAINKTDNCLESEVNPLGEPTCASSLEPDCKVSDTYCNTNLNPLAEPTIKLELESVFKGMENSLDDALNSDSRTCHSAAYQENVPQKNLNEAECSEVIDMDLCNSSDSSTSSESCLQKSGIKDCMQLDSSLKDLITTLPKVMLPKEGLNGATISKASSLLDSSESLATSDDLVAVNRVDSDHLTDGSMDMDMSLENSLDDVLNVEMGACASAACQDNVRQRNSNQVECSEVIDMDLCNSSVSSSSSESCLHKSEINGCMQLDSSLTDLITTLPKVMLQKEVLSGATISKPSSLSDSSESLATSDDLIAINRADSKHHLTNGSMDIKISKSDGCEGQLASCIESKTDPTHIKDFLRNLKVAPYNAALTEKVDRKTMPSHFERSFNANRKFMSRFTLLRNRRFGREGMHKSTNAYIFRCSDCPHWFYSQADLALHRCLRAMLLEKFASNSIDKVFKVEGRAADEQKDLFPDSNQFAQSNLSTYEVFIEMKSVNKGRHFTCSKCPTRFKSFSALLNHKSAIHSEISLFKCHICNKQFDHIQKLSVHVAKSHKIKEKLSGNENNSETKEVVSQNLQACEQKSSATIRNSEENAAQLKSSTCIEENAVSSKDSTRCEMLLSEEGIKVKEEKEAMLENLVKKELNAVELANHCSKCNKSFKFRGGLKSHINQVHSTIRCPQCARKFTFKKSMEKHFLACHASSSGSDCTTAVESFVSTGSPANSISTSLEDSCVDSIAVKNEIDCSTAVISYGSDLQGNKSATKVIHSKKIKKTKWRIVNEATEGGKTSLDKLIKPTDNIDKSGKTSGIEQKLLKPLVISLSKVKTTRYKCHDCNKNFPRKDLWMLHEKNVHNKLELSSCYVESIDSPQMMSPIDSCGISSSVSPIENKEHIFLNGQDVPTPATLKSEALNKDKDCLISIEADMSLNAKQSVELSHADPAILSNANSDGRQLLETALSENPSTVSRALNCHERRKTRFQAFSDILRKENKSISILNKDKILKKSWKCDKCPKKFGTKGFLERHNIAIHGAPCKFSCTLCGRKFTDFRCLRFHHKTKHAKKKWLFQSEGVQVHNSSDPVLPPSQSSIENNSKVEIPSSSPLHLEKSKSQGDSQKAFKRQVNRKQANRKKRRDAVCSTFKCNHCELQFDTKQLLFEHNSQHHVKIERDSVQLSSIECKSQDSQERKVTPVDNLKILSAVEPDNVIGKELLSNNIDGSSIEPLIDLVPSALDLPGSFNSEILSNPLRDVKVLVDFKTSRSPELRQTKTAIRHKRKYEEIQQETNESLAETKESFKCADCPLSYRVFSCLKRHRILVHNEKAEFYCSICGKGFSYPHSLKNHVMTHSRGQRNSKRPERKSQSLEEVKGEPQQSVDEISNTNEEMVSAVDNVKIVEHPSSQEKNGLSLNNICPVSQNNSEESVVDATLSCLDKNVLHASFNHSPLSENYVEKAKNSESEADKALKEVYPVKSETFMKVLNNSTHEGISCVNETNYCSQAENNSNKNYYPSTVGYFDPNLPHNSLDYPPAKKICVRENDFLPFNDGFDTFNNPTIPQPAFTENTMFCGPEMNSGVSLTTLTSRGSEVTSMVKENNEWMSSSFHDPRVPSLWPCSVCGLSFTSWYVLQDHHFTNHAMPWGYNNQLQQSIRHTVPNWCNTPPPQNGFASTFRGFERFNTGWPTTFASYYNPANMTPDKVVMAESIQELTSHNIAHCSVCGMCFPSLFALQEHYAATHLAPPVLNNQKFYMC